MVVLGFLVLLRRRNNVMVFFASMCFSAAIYAFGYAMEMTRVVPELIKFWSRIEYIGMPFISSFLFLFVLHFVIAGRRIPKLVIILPLLMSFTIMIIRQTNHLHGLYYSSYTFDSYNGFMLMTFGKGLWYWIFAGFNILGIMLTALLVGIYLIRASRVSRRQGTMLLLGAFLPILPYIVQVTGLLPVGVDIIPASLTLSAFAFYIAIFRYNLFFLIPAGRDWLVETMADALIVLDNKHIVADANPSALSAFGLEGVDPVGQEVSEVMPLLDSTLESGKRLKVNGKVWELSRTPLPTMQGSSEGIMIVAHDVTELERLAREDMLTGLLNRHSWNEAAAIEISRLSRHKRYGSVIFMDLDNFKKVNDVFGHPAGDEVLRSVGGILKAGVRRPDLVSRYGGEEFVLFLPESTPEGAAEVAERLRADLENAVIKRGDKNIPITGSFGVSGCLITADLSYETLVSQADKALYESKHSGRNRVSLYS